MFSVTTDRYVMSGWNQLCSHVERSPVQTQSDCNEAAKSLGMEYRNASSFSNQRDADEDDPFGCFVNRYNQAYWKRQRKRAHIQDTREVCQSGNQNKIHSMPTELMYKKFLYEMDDNKHDFVSKIRSQIFEV